MEKKFTIPFQKEIEEFKIYVRSDGKGISYFDDLKIIETEALIELSGGDARKLLSLLELVIQLLLC